MHNQQSVRKLRPQGLDLSEMQPASPPMQVESIRPDPEMLGKRNDAGTTPCPSPTRAYNDATWDLDVRTNQVEWGDSAAEVLRYPRREVAKTFNWWAERVHTDDRKAITDSFTEALANKQVVPFYQPKVDLETGRVIGFEALARWQHPTRGVLTPGYFGVAFEDPEIPEMIGEAMIEQVAADLRTWLAAGHDCGRVAVNLSSAEFCHSGLAESVLGTLTRYGVPSENLEVEVTESVFLGASAEHVAETLKAFQAAGISIALDDFGTGFASLTHLKQFPVDNIKIDQSFVRGLAESADDQAIVEAVVGLGRNLRIQITAEGVETNEQARRLREVGCDFGQGYLYAKPMVGSRVPWFLANAAEELGSTKAPRHVLPNALWYGRKDEHVGFE